MRLSKNFVHQNLKKAEGAYFYGVPINELTREELIALVVSGYEKLKQQSETHIQDLNTLKK